LSLADSTARLFINGCGSTVFAATVTGTSEKCDPNLPHKSTIITKTIDERKRILPFSDYTHYVSEIKHE